ncbi:T9SS type B sorting domain-containing protein [Catalinimonas niigatensis]|uniref:T9SS type B sorting domain-containing protein n=1 Tax=Catalinimonas niigatensis TaxID=1397264 RepID=UPI0026670B58|nr:gliding motility-associated C-terminal domain-containing protein [Catalinimonas niigatensis]WPP49904.1 gliding motility-associated C-terminal domain-containing protein [Catalinimonas niigatensis]
MKHTYKLICFSFLFSLFALTAQAQTTTDEICGNGIDDDGNDLIDCADPAAQCDLLGFDCNIETDCGNGVDDDGDGFFDYYDGDCLNDPNNPNDYITIKPDCEAQPVGNVFEIEKAWDSEVSPNPTSGALGMPSVADLDQDGYPEVITMNSETGWLYILDGRDGTTIRRVRVKNGQVFAYPAVADVDGDGFGEIFTIDLAGVIRVYEHNLTLKWTATSTFTGFGRPLGLADFNQDGKAELYYVNEIRDAETGTLLVKGSHGSTMYPSGNNWQDHLNPVPVAINMLPAPGLELVVGHIIYTVNILNTGGTAGNSLTEALNMNNATTKPAGYGGYFPADADYGNQTFSQTAVVDYNLDGNLDVIIGGANGGINGPTTAFLWDLANNSVKTFTVTRLANTIPTAPFNLRGDFRDTNGNSCDNGETCYWRRGLGNINIADIDKDGQLEATFMSGSSLYALESDFTLKWANHEDFWESSSGVTGTTVFDFDGDGSSEIVYRDEIDLYIIDGITGKPLNNQISGTFCSSQTQADYPIVADVDGDGETEIIVSCGQAQNVFGQSPATSGTRTNGFIRAYKASGGNYWVPSRSLWNQSNYFNVNINDNLTVPRYQQSHHVNFAQICNDPNAPASFSLNKFLNQSPKISYCGQLTFPSPKLDFADDGVVITPPVCPDNQFQVRVVFQNNGSQAIAKPVPISFYGANPTNSYSDADESPYLETVYIDVLGGIKINQKVDTTFMVNALRGAFTLFVSLNDIGQNDSTGAPMTNSAFYPLTKLNGTIRECDDTPTIISKAVNPLPFEVKAVKLRDNRKCPGEVSSNNGEIEVVAPDDTPFPASSYAFTWTDISTGQIIGTNALVTGLDAGTYRVVVENTDYGCFGNADTVTVLRFEEWPDTQVVTLEELQPVSSCIPGTADGIARVLINGAAIDETQYKIEWEDEQQPGVLAIGDTATNLKPIRYKVTITNLLTGCPEIKTIDMTLDLPELSPTPTVTRNTNCKNPNGSITAQLLSGSVADYDYMLIQLSPAPQDTLYSTNPSFNNLAAGLYELRAYNPTSQCGRYSDGVEVEIVDQKAIDDLTVEQVKPQTACVAPYNGQLRAVIANSNQYSFVWYLGTVTTGPTAVVVGNSALTPDTLSTNLTDGIYTVVVTHQSSGCSTSAQIQLEEDIDYPEVEDDNINILSHQTICTPANGRVQISVGSANETTGYIFSVIRNGSTLATNETGLFTGLEAGTYSIEVQNKNTNCVAINTPTFAIDENTAFGDVPYTLKHQTSCSPAFADASITLNLPSDLNDYIIEWFEGTDTQTALATQPVHADTLKNVVADDYTVNIFNKATKCDTTFTITTLEDRSDNYKDEITIHNVDITHLTNCNPNPLNGAITATLVQSALGSIPDEDNYTFIWYKGSKQDVENGNATIISGENKITIDELDEGIYSVTAVRNTDGCEAIGIAEAEVLDHRNYPKPDINIQIVEQSSCDDNNPNGKLEADVAGVTENFIFNWRRNDGTGTLIDVALNTPVAENLRVGEYVLQVINETTNCAIDTIITLDDNIARGDDIELVLSSSPVDQCDPNNGTIEVTDVIVKGTNTSSQDDYLYDLYRIIVPGTDSVLVSSGNGPVIIGLSEGDYSIIATNDTTSCNSFAWPVTITRDPALDINFSFDEDEQSLCSPPNGRLEVIFPVGIDPNDYTYQWYIGQDITYAISGRTSSVLSDVRAETYTVAVTSNDTKCTTIKSWAVPPGANLLPIPDTDVNIIASNSCEPYDGIIEALVDEDILLTGDYFNEGYTQDDFFFYWFEGTTILRENVNSEFDHPDNYKPIQEPTTTDNLSTITGLKPGTYTVIIVDVKDGVDGYKCRSTSKHTYVVPAIAQKPDVVDVSVTHNSKCGTIGGGEISVEVNKKTGDVTVNNGFTFYWFNADAAGDLNTADFEETITAAPYRSSQTALLEGDYTVVIVDETTGCDTTIYETIEEISVPPGIDGIDVIAQRDCHDEPGSITVTSLVNSLDLADHDFYWYTEADYAAGTPTEFKNSGTAADWTWDDLNAGVYYVVAQNRETTCLSFPKQVTVDDDRHFPTISSFVKEPNTRCDGTGDGSITINLSDSPMPDPSENFDVTWTSTVVGFITVNDLNVTSSTLSNLLPGRYDYTITNGDTHCPYSGYFIIEDDPLEPKLLADAHDIVHITSCQNEGEITINQVEFDGNNVNVPDADFTFEWRFGTNDVTGANAFNDLVNNHGVSNNGHSITNLPAGFYFVWVRHANGCISERSKMFEIKDDSRQPIIDTNFQIDDILCDGVPDGEIEIKALEDRRSLPVNGYRFTWFDEGGNPIQQDNNVTVSKIVNLQVGSYSVEVLNNDTQCSNTRNYEIKGRLILPVLTVTKIADQSYCYGNGEAEVTTVALRGSTLNLSDFEYHWYENDLTTAIASPLYGLSLDSLSADSLIAGTYFVKAVNPATGCETLPVQFIIEDLSEPLIVVLDDISGPIIACDPTNFPEGEIEIEVRNSTNVITSWHAGSTISDPADSIAGFNNSFEIENLVPGTYTVWVQDTLTGCSTTRTYTIEGIEVPVVVSTSAKNFSSCIQPDGMIAANINGGSGDYIITWYSGSGTNMQQISSANNSTSIDGLTNGTYTVVVQDRLEPYCQESKAEVVIEDSRGKEIMVEVNNDFQMTNCDETVPNGQLSVAVSGELSRYNFFWYTGTNTNGKPIATGPVIAKLVPGEYTVLARDKVTGCISRAFTGEVIALPDTTIIPAPVVSTTPVTRCDSPNGTATAILDSAFVDPDVDYRFTWYNEKGEEVFSSSRSNTANFLAAGNYTVIATNVLSGCSSESASLTVGEDIYVPEFEIITTPSTCLEANGTIRLDFVESIKIVDIEWITPDGFATGFYLVNQPTGMYEVTITDDKGCKHTKTAEIKSNIHVYNGVSPNGDGKNDRFIISCIEQYDENVVRIYNRTGAIVYENFKYDNDLIFFEGYGNRGLYIGGAKLPEGTYYYIVDKKNGEEPVSGYLELLR